MEVLFELKGIKDLQNDLVKQASMEVVKELIHVHTSELQQRAVANALFKGHWGYKPTGEINPRTGKPRWVRQFIKPTGATRRSINMEIIYHGLIGHVKAGTHYSPYLEEGTRFMAAQPFMKPAFNVVSVDFKNNLNRLHTLLKKKGHLK